MVAFSRFPPAQTQDIKHPEFAYIVAYYLSRNVGFDVRLAKTTELFLRQAIECCTAVGQLPLFFCSFDAASALVSSPPREWLVGNAPSTGAAAVFYLVLLLL